MARFLLAADAAEDPGAYCTSSKSRHQDQLPPRRLAGFPWGTSKLVWCFCAFVRRYLLDAGARGERRLAVLLDDHALPNVGYPTTIQPKLSNIT